MLGVWQGSAAQQAQEMVPEGVRVVSALHTVSAASLSDLEHELGEDVLICGDARADKREAAALIERIGGTALRGLRTPGDGARDRVAHGPADRRQLALQGPRRYPSDRAARRAVGVVGA